MAIIEERKEMEKFGNKGLMFSYLDSAKYKKQPTSSISMKPVLSI